MTPLELADACEKAMGPDRGIDWAIHLRNGVDGVGAYGNHPNYTVSLDAAMTLVPEGLFPTIDFVTNRCWLRDRNGYDVPHGPAYGFAATPALALCAAGLRARGHL